MKLKARLNKKAIGIISVVSVLAMLIGIVMPIAANLINKSNADMMNAAARTTSIMVNNDGNPYFLRKGNSISEDVSGLAFAFQTRNIKGLTVREGTSEIAYDNATVSYNGKKYPLLGMGAIVHNQESGKFYTIEECDGKSILNVPAKYAFRMDTSDNKNLCTFAIRITDIPEKAYNTHITAIPYLTINIKGQITNLISYDEVRTRTFNEASEGSVYECENFTWDAVPTINSLYYSEDWTQDRAEVWMGSDIIPIPLTAGRMLNIDRLKIDIDIAGTITMIYKCLDCNKEHKYVVPKACRYHD